MTHAGRGLTSNLGSHSLGWAVSPRTHEHHAFLYVGFMASLVFTLRRPFSHLFYRVFPLTPCRWKTTSLQRWHLLSQDSPGLLHPWQVKETKQQVAITAAGFSLRGVVLPWAGRQLPAPRSISRQLLLTFPQSSEFGSCLDASLWPGAAGGWAANRGVDALALRGKSQ